jgi:hypothetical protein
MRHVRKLTTRRDVPSRKSECVVIDDQPRMLTLRSVAFVLVRKAKYVRHHELFSGEVPVPAVTSSTS